MAEQLNVLFPNNPSYAIPCNEIIACYFRLASLKKSGEEEWRKKVARNDPVFEILDSNSKLNFENEKTDCSSWDKKEDQHSEADLPTMRRNKGALRFET